MGYKECIIAPVGEDEMDKYLDNDEILLESVENEEEIERDIANVLSFTGYEPGSSEWKTAMLRWKRRRTSNPRMYKKFTELD